MKRQALEQNIDELKEKIERLKEKKRALKHPEKNAHDILVTKSKVCVFSSNC